MKLIFTGAAAAALIALSACSGNADDKAAENVEAAGDNLADNLEDQADNATNETVEDNLEDRADNVREAAEDKAEAIDDNDNSAAAGNGQR
jgi:hypothetical protein